MTNFPSLTARPDQKAFSEKVDDPAMRSPMEGGYEYSRPRTTRKPRRTWGSGYTNVSDADKNLLTAFWNQVYGGSNAFYWTNPVDQQQYLVKFSKAIEFKYVGIGGIHRWDITFEVREV